MERTRVGIVGASISGGWALQSHLPALLNQPAFEVTAVATSRLATAAATAQHFGIARFHDSAHGLAEDPAVDLVSVVVKIPDHADAVSAAIEAGKGVYCEWPLAVDTAGARRLRDQVAAAGVRSTIGLQARSTPALRYVRDLVSDGAVGRVLSVHASSTGLGNGGQVLAANREWTADNANGLSALTVRAAHTLDAVQFCVGRIVGLSARVLVATPSPRIAGTVRQIRRTAPDQVIVTADLETGATLSGRFLLGVRSDQAPLLTVHGTDGTLLVAGDGDEAQIQMAELRLSHARHGTDFTALEVPGRYVRADPRTPPGPARGVAENYLGTLTGASPHSPGFADAVALHELLDIIRVASATGTYQRCAP
jgi:predicted dehydrogenase